MKCEQCGRRSRNIRNSCLYCGGAIVSEQQEDTGPPACCACGAQMEPQEHHDVVIDVCTACDSIWFDNGELEALLQKRLQADTAGVPAEASRAGGVSFTPSGGGAYRKCPYCAGLMVQQNYKRMSGVIIDMCRMHGAFLDGGELDRILQFLAAGGAEKQEQRQQLETREAERAQQIARRRAKRKSREHSRRARHDYTFLLNSLF